MAAILLIMSVFSVVIIFKFHLIHTIPVIFQSKIHNFAVGFHHRWYHLCHVGFGVFDHIIIVIVWEMVAMPCHNNCGFDCCNHCLLNIVFTEDDIRSTVGYNPDQALRPNYIFGMDRVEWYLWSIVFLWHISRLSNELLISSNLIAINSGPVAHVRQLGFLRCNHCVCDVESDVWGLQKV